jgi:DNA-directed RNA polymerase specialized sigma24 family protein
MQTNEIAEVLKIAERTVRRRLAYAKAWLFRELSKGEPVHLPGDSDGR